MLLQSCKKESKKDMLIIEPKNAVEFDWREDSIEINNSDWTKVAEGNVFSWFSPNGSRLQNSHFGLYKDKENIKTFFYSTQIDLVFALELSADTVYLFDENNKHRTDIVGQIRFSPDTSLILHNTAISPAISISYRLER